MKNIKLSQGTVFYLLLLLLVPFSTIGEHSYFERIRNLKNIPYKSLTDSVKTILYNLTLENKETEIRFTQSMLGMDDILKGENYFLVLRHYAKIAPSNNQALFDTCLKFAQKNNLGSYISSLYVLKSTFFKKAAIYDSSMIYTLHARDEAIEYGNIEQKANVLHQLGDLYFSTGLYPKAKHYYTEVWEMKGSAEVWNSWRRRVIRNNLSLIEMNDGNYYKAIGLLDESRKEIGNKLNTKIDSLSLGYVYLTKAQALFFLKDYYKTNACIDSSLAIYEKLEDHSGLFNLHVLMARLSLINGDAKKAKELIDYAFIFSDVAAITQAERNEILLLQSNICQALGEQKQAMGYLRSYSIANDSLYKQLKFAQISQIQSENEYELLKINYEDIKTEKTLFFLFGIAAIFIIAVMSIQYFRIRLKNKRLVALSIDSIGSIKNNNNNQSGLAKKTVESNESRSSDVHLQRLANDLSKLIISDKLYLQSDLTLQKAAEMLGTNRTYLSKAINLELKQSFTTFINTLRIKESINLIALGHSTKQNINGLGLDVGFGNRASFISSFSKHTGMLPSTFVNNYEQILIESSNSIEEQYL